MLSVRFLPGMGWELWGIWSPGSHGHCSFPLVWCWLLPLVSGAGSLYLLVVLALWVGAGLTCGRPFLVDKNLTVSPDSIIFSLTPPLQALRMSCCSVTQSCPALCDPIDCSMPGFLVLHTLLEFAQTHVHWVDDAIQPSCPLSWTSTTCPSGVDPHPPPCCRITLFPGGFHNQS